MNKLIDTLSEYLAHNKAMPVLLGVVFAILNYLVVALCLNARVSSSIPVLGFIAQTNLLLHLGVILGLVGLLVGDAL